jgi:hypothetical protein
MANTFIDQIKAANLAKQRALSTLHVELGYANAQALASAILASSGGQAQARAVRGPEAAPATNGNSRKGRRVADSVRKAIADALKAGETATKLPNKFGVSYNIVFAIKKDLGMVTARGKKAPRSKRG